MSKKTAFFLVVLFLFFYLLNYLTPMSFGDDYVYSFIWQGHSEYVPLTEDAVRVSSLRDLCISQWSHYFTWSGRVVSHTIIQFFLWIGKDTFNFFNALVSVLLIVEIYWISHKGRITLNFCPGTLCFISFVLWAFTPGFSPVFFWLSGACNYLWTAVLLLGFLLPYVQKYYFFEDILFGKNWFKYYMFFLGLLAGWSNENSICWIIFVLSVFIYLNRNRAELESWMLAGLVGLLVGYALLMLAPGNVARLRAELSITPEWSGTKLLKENFVVLVMVFFFQFLLWYFSLRSLFILKNKESESYNVELKKERLLVTVLCSISFGMTAMMLFSPNFPPRSSFPGTVQLVIAVCVLLRIQEKYDIEIIKKDAAKFLCFVSVCYFTISVSATLYGFCDYRNQVFNILSAVKNSQQVQDCVITVPALKPVSETVANASGLHIIYYEMSEKENNWRNVAFSRYYGIKGIRMIKQDSKKTDSQPQD